MNFYVSIISETINFIEDNIQEKLSLEDIADKFCISEFHFNRMFRTVSGRTLKQYILGRKLTMALELLAASREPIIDIAYDLGFEYPEVFSRAFKKQFGISPNAFRKDRPRLEPVCKASLVERDIVSYQGSMTLKGTGVILEGVNLSGVQLEVDSNKGDFEQVLQTSGENFLAKAHKFDALKKDRLYAVVNCHGSDNGEYTVFYGMEAASKIEETNLKSRQVPGGPYESFVYSGDMFDIRETFIDDLYKWVMVKEIELEHNGVGMLNIFERDYMETHKVQILVPVKK